MKKIFLPLLAICLLFMAFQCEDDANLTKEQEQQELVALKQRIENLAETSVCNENTQCKFIAFGSKPCGGPWGYLIYSTSIDVEELESKVGEYNQKQSDFNTKYGIISDCSAVMPPTSLTCENNTCIPVY
ncbi:hypothetical protein [Confluentibacter lentus]|uniref:hypothetical protein n=1 Tax=Confluentibacter lentus TaxID=1699412 RepID=UPI0012FD61B3|nr:hypothetical protein [Confluentibacter lentus]